MNVRKKSGLAFSEEIVRRTFEAGIITHAEVEFADVEFGSHDSEEQKMTSGD